MDYEQFLAKKPGKKGGAYSSSIYGVHPYILMNWN